MYSSPLQRARCTAELAGYDDPRVTYLLREVDYGDYEWLTSSEIHESRPDWELYRDGCPDGESPAQIYARAQEFVALASSTPGAQRVLAFAHGHILRAIAVAWLNVDITVATGLRLDVATVSVLSENGHGRVIALWNAP